MRSLVAIGIFVAGSCGQVSGDSPSDDDPPAVHDERAADFRSPRVAQAVEEATDIVQTRGFAPTGSDWRGFLVDQSADVREQAVRAGSCYLVLAAASAAMRELDIRVFDSNGDETIQDGTDGATAAVRFCPTQSGTYYITVQASSGNGLFEARVFRGPTGLDVRIDDLFREVPSADEER